MLFVDAGFRYRTKTWQHSGFDGPPCRAASRDRQWASFVRMEPLAGTTPLLRQPRVERHGPEHGPFAELSGWFRGR